MTQKHPVRSEGMKELLSCLEKEEYRIRLFILCTRIDK
jgi:hypothetical protein